MYPLLLQLREKQPSEVSRKCLGACVISRPWVEMLRGVGDIVDRVKCIVWSLLNGHGLTMETKSNILEKHSGKRLSSTYLPHIIVEMMNGISTINVATWELLPHTTPIVWVDPLSCNMYELGSFIFLLALHISYVAQFFGCCWHIFWVLVDHFWVNSCIFLLFLIVVPLYGCCWLVG